MIIINQHLPLQMPELQSIIGSWQARFHCPSLAAVHKAVKDTA